MSWYPLLILVTFVRLCEVCAEDQVRGYCLSTVVVEQLNADSFGERYLLSYVLLHHNRLCYCTLYHEQDIAADRQSGGGINLNAVPYVEVTLRGIYVSVLLLVQIVSDLAVVLGRENKAHHITRYTVNERVMSVLALLNNLFEDISHISDTVYVDCGSIGVSFCEESTVKCCCYCQNVVVSTSVQYIVNAVQSNVLSFQFLYDLLVLVDCNSNRLSLDCCTLACGSCAAVVVRYSVSETSALNSTCDRVTAQLLIL